MDDILEKYQRLKKSRPIIGIDEVGRGAWAGPLVVAAVMLTKPINDLKDSKLMSMKKRQELSNQIKQTAYWTIAEIEPEILSNLNLHSANLLLMKKAAQALEVTNGVYFFDGYSPIINDSNFAVKSGDNLIPEISAASIIAKVHRDLIMQKYALTFDKYDFAINVGYGTKKHVDGLSKFGPCAIHRTNFKPIKLLLNSN